MSALDRVQSFLKSRAGRTALTVVPLAAAVAVSAQATIIFHVNSGGGASFSSPTLSLVQGVSPGSQALSELGGVVGLQGFGSVVGTATEDPPNEFVYFDIGGFLGNGTVTGGPFAPGQTVPLTWNFTLGTSDIAKQVHYRMTLNLYDGEFYDDVYDSGIKDTPLGGGVVSGHAYTSDLGGYAPPDSVWAFQLQVYINGMNPGTTLSLDIPQSSIDINAEPSADIPEPGAWFLMAGGTALLLIGPRLRKR
jgi:hypothetical protein